MWQVGDNFRWPGEDNILYKIDRFEGDSVYVTWSRRITSSGAGLFGRSILERCMKVNPEPQVEVITEIPELTKYVYVAYLKHGVRGTEIPLSAITEEKLEALIRAHDNRFTVLAKKRIKFII